jgi:hypothetical protein
VRISIIELIPMSVPPPASAQIRTKPALALITLFWHWLMAAFAEGTIAGVLVWIHTVLFSGKERAYRCGLDPHHRSNFLGAFSLFMQPD